MPVETIFTWLNENKLEFGVIAACLSAIFSLGSAIGSNRSANKARKNTQAQLTASLFDAYAATSMLESENCLRIWATQRGKNFASDFAYLRRTDYLKVHKEDSSRRLVAHYFEKIYALWEMNFIKKRVVRTIISRDQTVFLREVVEPLEAAMTQHYEKRIFEKFGRLHKVPAAKIPMATPSGLGTQDVV